jgi:peptide/nickel transport system permease protein
MESGPPFDNRSGSAPAESAAPASPSRRVDQGWVRGTLYETLGVLRANPLTLVGFVLVVIVVVAAILVAGVPWLTGLLSTPFLFGHALLPHAYTILPYDPNFIGPTKLLPPSSQHWFGTDELARDEFSRVLEALPLDLGIGLFVTLLSIAIGAGLGLVAGFWDEGPIGRAVSAVILRVTDVFLAFPSLVLALALAAILGRNLNATLIALTVTWWPYYVRIIRGEVLVIKHQGYIHAARIAGLSERRILFRHVLRNLLEPLTVYATLDIGTVIVTFSTISFIGIAVPETTPEWGTMIYAAQDFVTANIWLTLAPGAAIFLTVLGFSLLGDGLRDVLDPRTRRAFAKEAQTSTAPEPRANLAEVGE